jgi:L-rhamnose isomerase
MAGDSDTKTNFLNRRDWGSYLSALQSAATYPKVLEAVKSGRDWFTQSASEASNWLVGTTEEASSWLVSTVEPNKRIA